MTKDTDQKKEEYRKLPGVDVLLARDSIAELITDFGHEPVTSAIRHVLQNARTSIQSGDKGPSVEEIEGQVLKWLDAIYRPSLKKVINATGVIIHTNMGRAPLGESALDAVRDTATGYCSLELDLATGRRGHRSVHLAKLLTFITGTEDAIVVNNNAACLILALNTLAAGKDVIISRGELIEIGGSFRIPDIMAASGAKMVEVGTTNKTHLSDYESAITDQTALILKVHKSNYEIRGFTQEATVNQLADLAHSREIPFIYDIGSGLLRKPQNLPLENEPDVRSSLKDGADLVTFSGDKLLGGPQAGIIVGRAELVSRLAKAPMMRALRVGKLTIAALHRVIRSYLSDGALRESVPIFAILEQTETELLDRANYLAEQLSQLGVATKVIDSVGQCGGGTLPGLEFKSFAVALVGKNESRKSRTRFAEAMFARLLAAKVPVIGVLRAGRFLLDVLTIRDADLPEIISAVSRAARGDGQS